MAIGETNLRRDVLRVIQALIEANKPSGWTVRATYPHVDTAFPLILINPPIIESENWSSDRTYRDVNVSVLFEVMVNITSGNQKIDEGRDNIYATLINKTNQYSLQMDNNLELLDIKDMGEPGADEINDTTYLVARMMATFKRR